MTETQQQPSTLRSGVPPSTWGDRRWDRHLDVDAVTLRCPSLAGGRADDVVPELVERFNRYGVVVVQLDHRDQGDRELLALLPVFGRAWQHARSDARGVAVLEPTHDRPGYLGTSNVEHPPHTDGAYSAEPPLALAMHCEHPAEHGGDTVLLSSAHLFDQLQDTLEPAQVEALFAPDAVHVARREESVDAPLVERVGDVLHLRFRMDDQAEVEPSAGARPGYERLRDLAVDPANRAVLRLDAGQLVVLDNSAVLHARTAIPDGEWRKLRRLNMVGDAAAPVRYGFRARPHQRW